MLLPYPIIAIDGPSASGKGTLATKIAKHFNFDYMDTGILYRKVAYEVMHNNGDADDVDYVAALALNINNFTHDGADYHIEDIGKMASRISQHPLLRVNLFTLQRQFCLTPPSQKGAVLDGRDIGTVICPEALVKFFIIADVEIRATRRYKQLQNKNLPVIYSDVLNDLQQRDANDKKREHAPLKAADDAIIIDTTMLSIDDTLALMIKNIIEKLG